MRTIRFRGDLSLARQGLQLALGFGLGSLHGLIGVAELLEQSVYEAGSLHRTSEGFEFTLLNPPLRMGAFRSARLLWNGAPVAPDRVSVRPGGATVGIPFSTIDREHPFDFPIGVRTLFVARPETPPAGRQRVRLELRSVAIPPMVWFEFSDDPRREAGAT